MGIKKKELGQAIAYQRLLKGWSVETLGSQFELTGQAIRKWESGQTAPTVDKWHKLKETLGVDAIQFKTVSHQAADNKNHDTAPPIGHGAVLSAREATIIQILREKDKDGSLANYILAILLQDSINEISRNPPPASIRKNGM